MTAPAHTGAGRPPGICADPPVRGGQAPAGPALRALYRRPARQLGARRLAPAVACGAVSVACGIGLLATSGWLITRASQRPPVFELSVAIGAVQALALGRGLARYLQRLTTHRAALDLVGRLRLALFDTVEPLVPGALGPSTGTVLTGVVADADLVAEGFAKRLGATVDVAASIVVGTGLAALVDPRAALLVAAGAVSVVALALVGARLGSRNAADEARLRAELGTTVADTVRAAPELAAFGRLDVIDAALDAVHRRSLQLARRRATAVGAGRAAAVLAAGGALLATLAVALGARGTGRIDGVQLAVLAFVALATFDQLATLPAVLGDLSSAKGARAALDRLAAIPPPAPGTPPGGGGPTVGPRPPGAELRGATVRTGGATLLDEMTLVAAPGRRLALVGPNGAGKSTALHALLRFVGLAGGQAALGGADVRDLDRAEIAVRAGWLGDETHVFSATVRDNLRMARPGASDADCSGALASVGLEAWLGSLPGRLDEPLGAGGRPMSSGERQRLGLARSLLARQQVLLLDEPTAHLDPGSGPSTLDELLSAAGDRPVVLVSHDPCSEAMVDEVIEMDAGRVAARRPGRRRPG